MLIGLGAVGAASQAVAGPAFAQRGAVRNPFNRDSGMVVIEVEVGGRKVLAAVDNGAAMSLVDQAFAAQLGMSAQSRLKLNGVPARVAGALTIGVGGLPIVATPLISDLTMVSGTLGRPLAMVIGYEMFAAFVVQFDFERQVMSLLPPGSRGPLTATRISLIALPGRKFSAPLRIGAASPVPAMIDLGAASAIAVSAPVATRLGLISRQPQTTAAASVFIGDQPRLFISRLAVAPDLTFAGAGLSGAPMEMLAADEPVFSRYGVTIGAQILIRYDLWFDLPNRRMWARPNRNARTPFERDRIGLQGYMDGDAFRIMHVREKSPAWQAGLSQRDRVATVNGKPAGELIAELKYAAPAGKTYDLALAGGRTVTLTATDYY